MTGLLSMQKVNSSFFFKVLPRAFLILFVCLSLVAFSSYTAPKAQAEAFTLTLTSAFIMLVIAVMGTLGVTLVSSSNDDAVEYISVAFGQFLHDVKGTTSSIAEYLSSIGLGSIGLLGAPIHGAISIGKLAYDLIAEFCSWFFAEKNVVSGGNDVGELPISNVVATPRYGLEPKPLSFSSSGGTITLNNQDVYAYGDYYQGAFSLVEGGFNSVTVTSLTHGRYFYTGRDYWSYQCYLLCFVNEPSDVSYYSFSTSAVRERLDLSNISAPHTYNLSRTYNYIAFCIRPWDARGTSSGALNIYSPFSVTTTFSFQQDAGFVVSPSSDVIAPPSIAVGQTYNVPAEGVTDTSVLEEAIPAAIDPLTTTGGLSTTGTVAGTAVPAEYEWLYEDTQVIRNNTNPHFDFIPSTLGFDFTIWHYVTEMMSSVNSAIALFGTFVQNMPPAILVFPFGVFALCITVALFRRFLS